MVVVGLAINFGWFLGKSLANWFGRLSLMVGLIVLSWS